MRGREGHIWNFSFISFHSKKNIDILLASYVKILDPSAIMAGEIRSPK